jgi:hypothetical protein
MFTQVNHTQAISSSQQRSSSPHTSPRAFICIFLSWPILDPKKINRVSSRWHKRRNSLSLSRKILFTLTVARTLVALLCVRESFFLLLISFSRHHTFIDNNNKPGRIEMNTSFMSCHIPHTHGALPKKKNIFLHTFGSS